MTGKHPSRESAARQYLAQRYCLGIVGQSAPVFLVLGNHDGEGRNRRDNLGTWSNSMRKRYFPNAVPGGFYTGNATKDPAAGLLQDYYAWEWGDALFIVLDPFWYASRQGGGSDNWARTLGADKQGRGGVEAAPFYEWGGRNPDATDGFAEHRPGWDMPIHQLLVRNHVNVLFHGHDHFFSRQELDGVVYQLVPLPPCFVACGPRKMAACTSGPPISRRTARSTPTGRWCAPSVRTAVRAG